VTSARRKASFTITSGLASICSPGCEKKIGGSDVKSGGAIRSSRAPRGGAGSLRPRGDRRSLCGASISVRPSWSALAARYDRQSRGANVSSRASSPDAVEFRTGERPRSHWTSIVESKHVPRGPVRVQVEPPAGTTLHRHTCTGSLNFVKRTARRHRHADTVEAPRKSIRGLRSCIDPVPQRAQSGRVASVAPPPCPPSLASSAAPSAHAALSFCAGEQPRAALHRSAGPGHLPPRDLPPIRSARPARCSLLASSPRPPTTHSYHQLPDFLPGTRFCRTVLAPVARISVRFRAIVEFVSHPLLLTFTRMVARVGGRARRCSVMLRSCSARSDRGSLYVAISFCATIVVGHQPLCSVSRSSRPWLSALPPPSLDLLPAPCPARRLNSGIAIRAPTVADSLAHDPHLDHDEKPGVFAKAPARAQGPHSEGGAAPPRI